MNRVGAGGKGESVWLAWFLALHARRFRGAWRKRVATDAIAERWRVHARSLAAAAERSGWDGDWYRRAFFDDGTPLGSADNEECRIDSIAQSWAVISGGAAPDARQGGDGGGRAAAHPAATTSWRSSSRRRSTKRRSSPATSKDIRPAFARTAASIPTAPSG